MGNENARLMNPELAKNGQTITGNQNMRMMNPDLAR